MSELARGLENGCMSFCWGAKYILRSNDPEILLNARVKENVNM